jgi:recombination protein RecT
MAKGAKMKNGPLAPWINENREALQIYNPYGLDLNEISEMIGLLFVNNPGWAKCKPASVRKVCMDILSLGLKPDGIQAAVIKFGDELVYAPTARGLTAQAYETGEIKAGTINATPVTDKDRFNLNLTGGKTTFEKSDEPGETKGWYVTCVTVEGEFIDNFFRIEDIEKRRNCSPAWRKGGRTPWKEWTDEMQQKTGILMFIKKRWWPAIIRMSFTKNADLPNFHPVLKNVTPATKLLGPGENKKPGEAEELKGLIEKLRVDAVNKKLLDKGNSTIQEAVEKRADDPEKLREYYQKLKASMERSLQATEPEIAEDYGHKDGNETVEASEITGELDIF